MIERMTTKGTLMLLVAIKRQAKSDIKRFGKDIKTRDRITSKCYQSAVNYINVELPAIREVLGDSFKEKPQWQELTIKNT